MPFNYNATFPELNPIDRFKGRIYVSARSNSKKGYITYFIGWIETTTKFIDAYKGQADISSRREGRNKYVRDWTYWKSNKMKNINTTSSNYFLYIKVKLRL